LLLRVDRSFERGGIRGEVFPGPRCGSGCPCLWVPSVHTNQEVGLFPLHRSAPRRQVLMQSASCRCTVLNSSLMLSVSVCPCICLPFPLPHTLIVGHYAQYAAFIECPVYSGYIAGGDPCWLI